MVSPSRTRLASSIELRSPVWAPISFSSESGRSRAAAASRCSAPKATSSSSRSRAFSWVSENRSAARRTTTSSSVGSHGFGMK